MQQGTPAEKDIIKTAIETGGLVMLDQVISIVRRTGALEIARLAATQEAQRAIEAVQKLPKSPYSACLIELAAQLLDRQV
jgi:octaprenyl-diphosphate synthase